MAGPETIETGYAPIKAWIEGVPVEDAARRQLLNIAALPFIHQPRGRHAGRAPRQGRNRRLRHRHQGRDRAGGGRRRHRLRHDGGAHDAHGQRSARQPRQAAGRHRGGGAARRRRAEGRLEGRRAELGRPPVRAQRAGRRPEGARGEAPGHPRGAERHAPGLARRRQPLHRGVPRRGGARVGHAALGHRAASATASAPSSSRGRARRWTGAQLTRPLPDKRPRLARGRRAACSRTTSPRWRGRRSSRATTAR